MFKHSINLILLALLLLSSNSMANNEVKSTPSIDKQTKVELTAVNINTADIKTLSSLKGVGQKKAKAIVDFRDANGDFTSVDELLNIKGIGKHIVKDNITRLAI